jgi:hypothetical protein
MFIPVPITPGEGLVSLQIQQPGPGLHFGIGGTGQVGTIPGTNVLADVTAGHPALEMVGDGRRQDRVSIFDGVKGNAAA